MIALMDMMFAPTVWLLNLEPWIGYTLLGLLLCSAISTAGFVLARMKLSPLWVLLLLVPFVNVIAIWVLAYSKRWIHKIP